MLAIILTASLPACATAPPLALGPHADEMVMVADPNALIQMRRQGCLDEPCPVYEVAIFSDGTGVYDGRANVGVIGRRRLRLSAADLSTLISAIDAMDFLDSPSNCCVCPDAVDPSLVTLDYRLGSVIKTVVHDQRCPLAPRALSVLEREIDQSTGTSRLAGFPGHVALKTPPPDQTARR